MSKVDCPTCERKMDRRSKRCATCRGYGTKRHPHGRGYVRVYVPGHPVAAKDGYALEHRYVLHEADEARADAETLTADLRREWWLNHGHDFARLYGDDGEMQCAGCADFKRDSIDRLRIIVRDARMERAAALAAAQEPPAEGGDR